MPPSNFTYDVHDTLESKVTAERERALESHNRHPDEEFKYYRIYMLTPS